MNPETDSASRRQRKSKQYYYSKFYSNFLKAKGILDVLESIPFDTEKVQQCKISVWYMDRKKDTKEKAFEIIRKINTEKFINFNGVITGDRKINF